MKLFQARFTVVTYSYDSKPEYEKVERLVWADGVEEAEKKVRGLYEADDTNIWTIDLEEAIL